MNFSGADCWNSGDQCVRNKSTEWGTSSSKEVKEENITSYEKILSGNNVEYLAIIRGIKAHIKAGTEIYHNQLRSPAK